jgi:hypothetical protein
MDEWESLTHTNIYMNIKAITVTEISQPQKVQLLYDSTHMRYIEYSHLETEVEKWLGGERMYS